MKRLSLIRTVALALTFTIVSEPARAWAWDWLSLAPVRIEAVTSFDSFYKRYSGDSNGDSLDYQWDIGIQVDQQAYIIDPRIANFRLSLRPQYSRGYYDANDQSETQSGKDFSYSFQANLLKGAMKPYSFSAIAERSSNLNSGSLGSRYESDVDSKSAIAFWHNPAFPMRFTYQDRYFKQTFLSSQSKVRVPTTRRDEQANTLTVRGRSSKTTMVAEHLTLDDNVPGRNLDYQKDRLDLSHVLPWGKGSTLRSRLTYYDRRGFNPNRRIHLNERANIQHTQNISSQTRYTFSAITRGYDTFVNTGSFSLNHLLYRNLVTTATLWGMSQRSDPQDITRWRGGLSSRYSKNMFGAGVTAGLGYSYQVTDRNTREDLLEVIDESHSATLDGTVILNRRFIVTTSIIVTNADGSMVYEDGIDYTLLDLPEDLSQVQIIPGGQIEIGETILVSYQAIALPSLEYSTTNTNYRLGLNLGWMRFSHNYTDMDEKLISDQGDSFLNPRRDVRTNLEFLWKWSAVDVRVSANRNYNRRKNFETTNYTYRQSLDWSAFGNTFWNLSAVESFIESAVRDTDLYRLQLSVNWQPRPNLSILPILSYWKRHDQGKAISTGERDDQYIEAGFRLNWRYRKVTFNMSYYHNQRIIDLYRVNSDESKTNEDRLAFNLRRRF